MNFQHLNFGKFTNFIAQNILPKNTSFFVGRWTIPGISNSNHNVNKIFDRNNEDHCGVCIINNKIKKNEIDEDYYEAFIL